MDLGGISARRHKPVMLKPLHGSAWAWQTCVSCSSSLPKINYWSAVCCGKAGGRRGLCPSCREATFILLKYSHIPHVFWLLQSWAIWGLPDRSIWSGPTDHMCQHSWGLCAVPRTRLNVCRGLLRTDIWGWHFISTSASILQEPHCEVVERGESQLQIPTAEGSHTSQLPFSSSLVTWNAPWLIWPYALQGRCQDLLYESPHNQARPTRIWSLSSAVSENCFSQTAHNSSCPHNRLTSWVRAWVYTPSDWGGNPGLLPRLGVQDISSIHSSIKGRWQQQQPYFKRDGRVLHLKIKCRGLVLEERVQSMKTQEQRSTLHALSPIDHSGILQSRWG